MPHTHQVGELQSRTFLTVLVLARAHQLGDCPTMNRIKELRERAGVSQEALAEQANTSSQQISRLEKGTRRLTDEWMRRLAGPLGCLPHELMAEAVEAPFIGETIKDKAEVALIRWWRILEEPDRRFVLRMMGPPAARDDAA